MGYDEKDAIAFIRAKLPEESDRKYDDDEILNVIDIIWDYYEDNGMLDISFDNDDEDPGTDDIIAHARKLIAKDRWSPISQEDVEIIVRAEIEYEQSIETEI